MKLRNTRIPVQIITFFGFNIELCTGKEVNGFLFTYRKFDNLEDWYNWKRKYNVSLIIKFCWLAIVQNYFSLWTILNTSTSANHIYFKYTSQFVVPPKLYIPSTINIWKKVLTKAIWADKNGLVSGRYIK